MEKRVRNIGDRSIIGRKYLNNEGFEFTVTRAATDEEVIAKGNVPITAGGNKVWHYWIKFTATGYKTMIGASSLRSGRVKDRFQGSVYGVGIIGNVENPVSYREYQLWRSMIQRVHQNQSLEAEPTYGNVTICARWLRFESFLQDVYKLPNYQEWLKGQNSEGIKFHLDKDTLSPEDGKRYSPVTCQFIPAIVNVAHSKNPMREELQDMKQQQPCFTGIMYSDKGSQMEYHVNNIYTLAKLVNHMRMGKYTKLFVLPHYKGMNSDSIAGMVEDVVTMVETYRNDVADYRRMVIEYKTENNIKNGLDNMQNSFKKDWKHEKKVFQELEKLINQLEGAA